VQIECYPFLGCNGNQDRYNTGHQVCRKPADTGLHFNFNSDLPPYVKIGWIKSLHKGASIIFQENHDLCNEIVSLRCDLQHNGNVHEQVTHLLQNCNAWYYSDGWCLSVYTIKSWQRNRVCGTNENCMNTTHLYWWYSYSMSYTYKAHRYTHPQPPSSPLDSSWDPCWSGTCTSHGLTPSHHGSEDTTFCDHCERHLFDDS
jgi:hypothetical protein